MKNKYIFLIIALGIAGYFIMRPQTGMSGADTQQAQVSGLLRICMNMSPTSPLAFICDLKKQFINLGSTSGNTGNNTGGNTGATGGNNGLFITGSAASAQSPTTNSFMKPGVFMTLDPVTGTMTTVMPPTYNPGPAWPSVMCSNWTMRVCTNNICPRC